MDDFIASQRIEIEGHTYTFQELVGIDETKLNQEFKVNPARLTYFGARTAVAEALYTQAEAYTKRIYSDLELNYRESLPEQGIKPTEPMIKAYVLGDERYVAAQQKEYDALRDWKLLRAVVDGLKDRSQMLISLGAQLRQEFEYQDITLLATKDKLRQQAAMRRERDDGSISDGR